VLHIELSPPQWRNRTVDDVNTYNMYRIVADEGHTPTIVCDFCISQALDETAEIFFCKICLG